MIRRNLYFLHLSLRYHHNYRARRFKVQHKSTIYFYPVLVLFSKTAYDIINIIDFRIRMNAKGESRPCRMYHRNIRHRKILHRKVCTCGVCQRIELTRQGKNPYFVRELETGYVVIGDYQRFPALAG